MGDRVSIQFKDKYGKISPYLYSHWGGMSLVEAAKGFAVTIRDDEEAGDAMVKFIQSSFAERFDDLHLEFNDGGDNGDNGNHAIFIESKQSRRLPLKKKPTKDEVKKAQVISHNTLVTAIQNLTITKRGMEKALEEFDRDCGER